MPENSGHHPDQVDERPLARRECTESVRALCDITSGGKLRRHQAKCRYARTSRHPMFDVWNKGRKMRADSALSHLYHNEPCIAMMKDGSEQKVRWNKECWCFFYTNAAEPTVCTFDEIEEWRPASIKF
jgi:hypothetical protein